MWSGLGFRTVTDFAAGAQLLRRRRYGVIVAAEGQWRLVRLRPLPFWGPFPELRLVGHWYHRFRRADRCWVYYNQPRRFPNFLAVTYILSGRGTSWGTVQRALEALDEIARLKRVDALLCDVANRRISPAIMARWGWEPHCPSRWHRHYIKRFYGHYPRPPAWIAAPGMAWEPPLAVRAERDFP